MRSDAVGGRPRNLTAAFLVLLAATLGLPSRSQATCRDPDETRLLLRLGEAGFDLAFERELRTELHSAVQRHGLRLCRAQDPAADAPSAIVVLRAGTRPAQVRIALLDRFTRKQLKRTIDLVEFDEDTRAFALAVAIEELLRASWLELAMDDAPEPEQPPPPQVIETVERTVERASPPRTTLRLQGSSAVYSGGQRHLGGGLGVEHRVRPWLSLGLTLQAHRGLTEKAPNGSVRASLLGGEGHFWVRALQLTPLELGPAIGVHLGQVSFEGQPAAGASGTTGSGLVAVPYAAAVGLLGLGRLELRFGVGAGLVAAGLAATDDGRRATAVSGMALLADVGIGVRL